MPDPTILARGLSRITKKLTMSHPELQLKARPRRKKVVREEKPLTRTKKRADVVFSCPTKVCGRGKSRTYSHDIKDDRRRCWNCGETDHMATTCSRPKEAKEGSTQKTEVMKGKREKVQASGHKESEETEEAQASVKDLLKEANNTLKAVRRLTKFVGCILVTEGRSRTLRGC